MSDEMTAMDLCDFYVGSQGRESPMANETVRVNYKDFMAIRTGLAQLRTENAAMREALEKIANTTHSLGGAVHKPYSEGFVEGTRWAARISRDTLARLTTQEGEPQ